MDAVEGVLGIDIGGTKILSLCLGPEREVLGRDLRPTLAEQGPEAVVRRLAESARAAAAGRRLLAAGLSTAGPVNLTTGVVTSPPNLPGWRDVPLRRLLSEALGLPVQIEKDTNAAVIAEHALGAARGAKHAVFITVSTGIGGGLILNGEVYRGTTGGGGEIGHMQLDPRGRVCGCGRRGCLEALASGSGLAAAAREIAAREPEGLVARVAAREGTAPDARVLGLAADEGDATADAAIREAGRYLGAGLANLVDVFDPQVIVIGGSLRHLGERYLGPALEVVERETFAQHRADVRLAEAELGDEASAIGAALVARSEEHWLRPRSSID